MTREEKINTLKAIIQECEEYQWQRRETLLEIIKDLEQEPNDLEVDCVSRQAVIEITAETGALETQDRVKALPSVAPIRPKGHWITETPRNKRRLGARNGYCSVCKDFYTDDWDIMNYCPNCGADMREVEE